MIRTVQLQKKFVDAERELSVIEGLTCDFPSRGMVAIVGRSGIGKSTLLHLLGGLDTPTSGQIFVADEEITGCSPDRLAALRSSSIGFIFQSHHLLPEFSAEENVALPLLLAGRTREDALQAARRELGRMGLSERATHRPSALSGGEQQRVSIARAVVSEPRVILADEPTGNLDPATGSGVQQLLREICNQRETLMVLVTHNPDLAASCDLVLEMHRGGRLERVR